MPYGDWTWGPEDTSAGTPTTQEASATTESATPATDRAQGQFGTAAIVTFILGFLPGLQVLWAGTLVCLVVLAVSPAVGSLEASSSEKARANGGGCGDVVLAGVICLILAVGTVLFMASLAGGGL
jgi:hypothetical protein